MTRKFVLSLAAFCLLNRKCRVTSFYRTLCIRALIVLLFSSPLSAHRAEPISTEFALPFGPGSGNLKIIYEYEREGLGASRQALPELELEFGGGQRWQLNLGFPLIRLKEGRDEPSALAGGKLEVGMRYLLFGGARSNYAVSFQGTVEAPTGNRRLFGNTPELSPGLFFDRYVGQHIRLHSNLSWRTTVGDADEPERAFEYRNAVLWFASERWVPGFELLGATNTDSGETAFAVQPEVIFLAGPHLELKLGMPVGLTSNTPDIGVRAQVSILWGETD